MSTVRNRLEAESSAQDHHSCFLGPLVTLVEQTISLYERALDAIAEHPRPGAAAKVGLILTARLANDLRVCSLSAQQGIEASLRSLGISSPTMKENWRQAYTFMCTAKHANPRLSLLNGLRIDASGFSYLCGPDPSAIGAGLSAEALYNAIFLERQGSMPRSVTAPKKVFGLNFAPKP
jgi:hypothetical protein